MSAYPNLLRVGRKSIGCTVAVWLAVFWAMTVSSQGGEPPFGATLVGTWDYVCTTSLDCPFDQCSSSQIPCIDNRCDFAFSDVYGDGNYAYIGHFGDAGVDIIDISNPANPTWVAEVRSDAPNCFASQQDLKVHEGMLFIALESDGNDGVLIVDVRDPTNPIKRTLITVPNYANVHNMYYDAGFLYLANSQTPNVGIIDLRTYDLDAAPATITTPHWMMNSVGSSFVHDIHVRDVPVPGGGTRKLLYACGWNSGLLIYDATNVATQIPALIGTAPGQSTHSCWPTDDGKFVVTGEERSGGGIKVFEIGGTAGALTLTLRDSFSPASSIAFSVHNQLIDGYRLYNAWYQWGMAAFDIDPVTGALSLVANYDTFLNPVAGFNGAWGVYPFLGPDKVLVSDIETGLYVVSVTGAASIELPNGLPQSVHPRETTPVLARVIDAGLGLTAGSVKLHATVDGGSPQVIDMIPLGGMLFQGEIPATPCTGDVEIYFSAETASFQTFTNPVNAPASQYSLTSKTQVCENFRDNFEQNLGWTVGAAGDNATSGLWTRVNPNGTSAQPEDDNPNGTGTMCFVTGQGTPGGAAGAADVDGGRTTLTSPVFNATFSDVTVGYHRWYSNDLGGAPNEDSMFIDISNNGGASWVSLEVVTENRNAWVEKRFRVADFVAPTANVRVRFIAEDAGAGSLVEAGVDDFILIEDLCSDPAGNTMVDDDLDLADYAGFDDCMAGPGAGVAEGCCAYDTDLDDDVDMVDYLVVHAGFTGPV